MTAQERIKELESLLTESGQAVVRLFLDAKTREERKRWGSTLNRINVTLASKDKP
jgi:polyphosphate kinase 2 (PPK2 family)